MLRLLPFSCSCISARSVSPPHSPHFPTCTMLLYQNTSQECGWSSKMVLPLPRRFCMLFKNLATSTALQSSVILWLWMLEPSICCWKATKLMILLHSVQHEKGSCCYVNSFVLIIQLFHHPLKSLHSPDALPVQGHVWLLYQHHSILLIYSVSKQDCFGDHPCPVKYWFFCSNWSSDFSLPNISL